MENDGWCIVDEATQSAARIGGVEMSSMADEEARQILKILKSVESVRSISVRASASAKKLARSVSPKSRQLAAAASV
jgi:hypothetical protein